MGIKTTDPDTQVQLPSPNYPSVSMSFDGSLEDEHGNTTAFFSRDSDAYSPEAGQVGPGEPRFVPGPGTNLLPPDAVDMSNWSTNNSEVVADEDFPEGARLAWGDTYSLPWFHGLAVGKPYVASYHVKGLVATGTRMRIRVEYYDVSGNHFGGLSNDTHVLVEGMQRVAFVFSPPENTHTVRLAAYTSDLQEGDQWIVGRPKIEEAFLKDSNGNYVPSFWTPPGRGITGGVLIEREGENHAAVTGMPGGEAGGWEWSQPGPGRYRFTALVDAPPWSSNYPGYISLYSAAADETVTLSTWVAAGSSPHIRLRSVGFSGAAPIAMSDGRHVITISHAEPWEFRLAAYVPEAARADIRAGDFIEFTYPQIEPGPIATSYIPTTGAPATRDGESLSLQLQELFNTEQGTLTLWSKLPTEWAGYPYVLLGMGEGEDPVVFGGSELQIQTHSESGIKHSGTTENPITGNWQHFALRWNADQCELLVDTKSVLTISEPELGEVTSDLFLGSWVSGTHNINNPVAGVKMYRRSLTDEEILDLYFGGDV